MPSAFGQLISVNGGDPILLGPVRCVVGRAADCDVVLPYRTVSLKHCLLEIRDDAWYVVDLASSNGIRIDGVRCREGRLSPGSVLSIAEHRFEMQYEPLLGTLVPLDGGATIPLWLSRLVIGRSAVCNIVLPNSDVSGKHCQLDLLEGEWHVLDLGSRNGIQVEGNRVTAAILKPNAIVSIAKHRFQIVYEVPEDVPVDVPEKASEDDFEINENPVATLVLVEAVQTDRVVFDAFPEATLTVEGRFVAEPSASERSDLS